MHTSLKRTVYWAPRILAIAFALFVSIFALDVFGEGQGFWRTLAALLIHLIPTYLVLIALAVAWRWEWVGAVLFVGLAIWYVVMSGGRQHWSAYLVISGSLLLLGGLFAANWIWRGELKPATYSVAGPGGNYERFDRGARRPDLALA